MNELTKKVLDAAKREGLDLIGIAPKSRFDGIEAEHNPFSIFPEGKSVILVGNRICRGSLRGVEEGTNFGDYGLFGRSWLEDEFIAIACYGLVNAIEDEGWEAVPIFPNPTEVEPMGVAVAEGRPAPNVHPDFDYAAVACGLCEIGKNGLALSPIYGSRQRFHMIITDAELEPTPILEKSVCDGCGKCAKSCPLGAINTEETEEIEICGKKMTVYKVDYEKCKVCKNGTLANRFTKNGKPDRIAALCNRTCMCHLEENGVLSNKFENSFRKREAWALDAFGNYANTDDKEEIVGGCYTKK